MSLTSPRSKFQDFATPEEEKAVNIGDEIVSAGLVPGLSGQKLE